VRASDPILESSAAGACGEFDSFELRPRGSYPSPGVVPDGARAHLRWCPYCPLVLKYSLPSQDLDELFNNIIKMFLKSLRDFMNFPYVCSVFLDEIAPIIPVS
jgi:hypothetical protein